MDSKAWHEQEKENMRTTILKVATEIIVAEGYSKLSINKIADVMGLSPAEIYFYYKGNTQIIDDMARRVYEENITSIKKALAKNPNAPIDMQLELIFKEFIYSITNNPMMGKALIISGTQNILGPENKSGILQKLLTEGQQNAVLRDLEDNAPWRILSALLGFSIYALNNGLYLGKNWPELISGYSKILLESILVTGKRECSDEIWHEVTGDYSKILLKIIDKNEE